ncbi:hypothetical protein D9M72_196730 [compost metagenome]|jgi:hypothetical protein
MRRRRRPAAARRAGGLADDPSNRILAVRVVWALVSAYIVALPPGTASTHQRL